MEESSEKIETGSAPILVCPPMPTSPEMRDKFFQIFANQATGENNQPPRPQGPEQSPSELENERRRERNEEMKRIVKRRHKESQKRGNRR